MWVYCGAGVFSCLLVATALAFGGSSLPLAVQIPLALILLIPWFPGIRQQWVSPWFVLMSLVPTAILTWTGGSPLFFGLMALSASRVAITVTVPKSIAYGATAIGIVLVRPLLGHQTNWMVWKTYVELGMALGFAMRSQRLLLARNKEASIEHARVAALDERRRIARDVHDVLAHTLTILMVHLNSARLSVREDPEGTAELLDEVAQYGRTCLDEIRRTVGLLSESPSSARVVGPIETAHAIEDLVGSYRKAGVDVELRLDVEMAHMGRLAEAPPEVWEGGYRIVQESLANATKHAPKAPVDVWIGVDDTGLHMKCSNQMRPGAEVLELPSGGNGITGMRERVLNVGGTFSAGPEGSAWVIRADLPLSNDGDAPAAHADEEGVATGSAIEDLVASYRGAGLDIDLRFDVEMEHMGRLADATPEFWQSAYDIVEETVASTAQHAPNSRVHVTIGVNDVGIHVMCSNEQKDGDTSNSSERAHVPLGIRERVAAVGGTFLAGFEDGDAWVIRADLPLSGLSAVSVGSTELGRAS
jgi:signal transduction histidine kinase